MSKGKLLLLCFLFGCHFLHAQNKELLYDFTEIPQSLMLNPGMEVNYLWYAGIPTLSGISTQFGTSGVTVHDLFADDGVDFTTKVLDKVIYSMNPNDELSGGFQMEIFNGGFRGTNNPDNFYSFGMYLEGDAIAYWFKDLAILGFEGNADQLNRRFDLSHIKTRGELVNVFHFGINKRVDNKLTIGARAKIYSSLVNFNSTANTGYFVTTEGQNNFLANTLDADLAVRTSGIQELLDGDADETPGIIAKRMLFGGNLGLGLDAGLTYNLNKKTVVTVSVLDLGFIYHTKDIKSYELNGNATVEGIEFILPEVLINPSTDFWQDLVDEIEELVPFEDNDKNYISFRPTKLYGSIRHNFGERIPSRLDCDCMDIITDQNLAFQYVNSAGIQLYAINRPRGPQVALTAFYQRRFGNFLALKTTYTIDKYSFSNVGFGFNIQAGAMNFYAMADNLLAYKNIADTHYASFQLGLNIISWGKK
ncbi:MAG: hypothetical protein COA50_12610 [Flavobacteriaceae bacterium]|nr:MAG: hypothetical protein COA50_12610 [Flavobacteriaceae bacterium]